jgi:hypothetical protein
MLQYDFGNCLVGNNRGITGFAGLNPVEVSPDRMRVIQSRRRVISRTVETLLNLEQTRSSMRVQ